MERREPSVRELFRTATRLALTFVVRPPSGAALHGQHAAPPGGLVRSSSGGSRGRPRSASLDAPRPASASQITGSDAEAALKLEGFRREVRGAGSVWPEGSRPASPADDPGV